MNEKVFGILLFASLFLNTLNKMVKHNVEKLLGVRVPEEALEVQVQGATNLDRVQLGLLDVAL